KRSWCFLRIICLDNQYCPNWPTRILWLDFKFPFARHASRFNFGRKHLTVRFYGQILGRKILRRFYNNRFRLWFFSTLPVNKRRVEFERRCYHRCESEDGRSTFWIGIVGLDRNRLYLCAGAVADVESRGDLTL